jgi:hypothetical protein
MDTSHNPPPNTDVNPQALAQGHEPDKIDTRIIVYVPIVLMICFLFSWLIVTWIIGYARSSSTEPPKKPLAVQRQSEPLNERLGHISSTDPHAEWKEPRLDGLNRLKTDGEKDFLRSFEPLTDSDNAPALHPDDLRPSSARSKKLGLQSYSWIKKDELARIPVDEALRSVLTAKNAKSPSGSFIAFQLKDGKPVQLSDLLKGGPTAANPQAHTSPKAPGPRSDGDHGAHP